MVEEDLLLSGVMGCAGTMGLKGDLTAGEIVEQLVHAQGITRIKNVVFMVRSRVWGKGLGFRVE